VNHQSDPGCIVLIPVFQDLESCRLLLPRLEQELGTDLAGVVIVDDGSDGVAPEEFLSLVKGGAVEHMVLHLRRNVGHQRAIAIGLCWIHDHLPGVEAVLVMDGDGEDRPQDAPRLLMAMRERGGQEVIFAERRRRSEGLAFRMGYVSYRWLHYVLTGIPVRFGNFSVLPSRALDRLVVVSDLWNHYAAAVVKSRVPYSMIPTTRGARLAGETKMNTTGLVIHGMSALSVFAETISVRLIRALVLLTGAGACMVGVMMAWRWWQRDELLVVSMLDVLVVGGILVSLAILGAVVFFGLSALRSGSGFIPLRDYRWFVHSTTSVPSEQGDA
jgi:hypothetical protein